MNSLLRNWIAQMDSWEAASEFGIPKEEWAQYNIIERSDDVYIASFSGIFDALRMADMQSQQSALWSLAKTLLVYSRGAAARYLSGVQRDLNQLYSAALFYMSGYPATATFLAQDVSAFDTDILEEKFLLNFLGHDVSAHDPLSARLASFVDGHTDALSELLTFLTDCISRGLLNNPRQFISAKLASSCIERFSTNNIWKLLRENVDGYSLEAWQEFFSLKHGAPMWELLPSQQIALSQGLLRNVDATFSLQMPTSAGKTSLCELLIYSEVKLHRRGVLFLVPFRALAAEIQRGMSKRLRSMGIKIVATHGGNIPSQFESSKVENAEVLIVTPEKFAALEQVLGGLSKRFATIICDEGHLIDDTSRGLGYELLLTRLRSAQVPGRRFIFLSAILPNVGEIHKWLGGDETSMIASEYRPVDMDYAFLVEESRASYRLDMNPTAEQPRKYFLRRFLVQDDFRYSNPTTGREILIGGWNSFSSFACAAALKARRTGPAALFTTTRGENGIQGLGEKILTMLSKRIRASQGGSPETPGVLELHEFLSFLLGPEHLLSRLVSFGVGYHHGHLPQEIRRAIEEGVQDGTINLIICTNTLAEGVNLPIRSMIIHTVRRYNPRLQSHEYIQRRSIKNIIGRAGRAGKETRGRVIFVNCNERGYVEQVLRDQELERATGILFKLIERLNGFSLRTRQELTNELFAQQDASFLSLIDNIDLSLLELISPDAYAVDLEQQLTKLLDQTLARQFCTTMELRQSLETVFRLRAAHLASTVEKATWSKLRNSGATPRFWTFVKERELLQHPLWTDLNNPLDDRWLQEVISPLFDFCDDISTDRGILLDFIRGWMSGQTYSELAAFCRCPVDKILDLLCDEVGFLLQDRVAKLCQLALENHDSTSLSEVARSWASLLQYGLGSLQQMDLFERGVSDRLAAWGVMRYLSSIRTEVRGKELTSMLRKNGATLRAFLEADGRVPTMSVRRLIRELRLAQSAQS